MAIYNRTADELMGREIWLKFATWILLGLEFALAADLLRTAVAPTWEDIAKLAVIAAIRTMLNYFWRRTSPPSTPPGNLAGFRPQTGSESRMNAPIHWTATPERD